MAWRRKDEDDEAFRQRCRALRLTKKSKSQSTETASEHSDDVSPEKVQRPRRQKASQTTSVANSVENRSRSVPGKITPEVAKQIAEAHASGLTIGAACHAANVSHVAWIRYLKRDPEFAEGPWAEAQELFVCKLEERAVSLALQADSRNCTMLIFMLKARKPAVYRDNVAIQHSGSVEFAGVFAEAMNRVVSGETSLPRSEVH